MNVYILPAIAVWWSVVVVIFALGIQDIGRDIKEKLMMAVIAICWPLLVPFGLLHLTYVACISSTKQIRRDLKNRGILAEFNEWHEEYIRLNSKETILTKTHPLAQERKALADMKARLTYDEWQDYLDKQPSDVYASWIQEPYPGPGDID